MSRVRGAHTRQIRAQSRGQLFSYTLSQMQRVRYEIERKVL